ncbi:MAG: tRNA (adenosine(37)-N6)-threonylcarbamoyltransferase complex dimerization subunit type 1 TsaB [Acidobacteria bacterium]|nr:tRNA (adenosine(37)-N6)-threonylcarbamoyltransferase complex dimerization subunit type 1 TsaB [Acidobacteriota bacterium]
MVILALDTTTAEGSAALMRDGRLLEVQLGDPAVRQGQRLPGELETLLARHGLTTASVDRYAVALGPGSFTGIRVGIATMQALALVHGRSVVGLSVMDVLAEVAAQRYVSLPRDAEARTDAPQPEIIISWVDAKRGEVFGAMYELTDDHAASSPAWRTISGPIAEPAESLLDRWTDQLASRCAVVLGDGVPGSRVLLEARLQPGSMLVDDVSPLAGVMAQMANREPWATEATTPHALRPVYVRRHYADVARAKTGTYAESPA